jgi:ferritin
MFVLVETLVQKEVTLERTNSAVYRQMADELDNLGWGGMAKWMRKASDDETSHADAFGSLLVDRKITPIYDSLPAIESVGGEPPAFFHKAYDAEVRTTGAISEIYKEAQDANEYLVAQFCLGYLEEQRRSEREVWDIIQMLEASDEWRLIDEKLGE